MAWEEHGVLLIHSPFTWCSTAKAVATASIDGDRIAAWAALTSLYEKTDPLNISNLRSEINEISLEEGGNVEEYISLHSSLVERIWYREGRTAISKTAEIAYFLQGLPLSMRSWVFLKNTQKDLTIETLRSELHTNSEFKKASLHSSSHRHDESSFYSQNHGRDGKRTPSHCEGPLLQNKQKNTHKFDRKSTIKCFYCRKMGHIQSECRLRLANEQKGSSGTHRAKSSSKYQLQWDSSKVKESSMVANEGRATNEVGGSSPHWGEPKQPTKRGSWDVGWTSKSLCEGSDQYDLCHRFHTQSRSVDNR